MSKKLSDMCKEKGVTIKCSSHIVDTDDKGWKHRKFTVQVRYEGRTLTTPYMQGMLWTRKPTVAEVLHALLLDASSADVNFDEWCSEFGYDNDSRKAFDTYTACVRNARLLKMLLGSDYRTFAECEE